MRPYDRAMSNAIAGSNCTKAIEILPRGIARPFERCKSEENEEETEGKGRTKEEEANTFVRAYQQ